MRYELNKKKKKKVIRVDLNGVRCAVEVMAPHFLAKNFHNCKEFFVMNFVISFVLGQLA